MMTLQIEWDKLRDEWLRDSEDSPQAVIAATAVDDDGNTVTVWFGPVMGSGCTGDYRGRGWDRRIVEHDCDDDGTAERLASEIPDPDASAHTVATGGIRVLRDDGVELGQYESVIWAEIAADEHNAWVRSDPTEYLSGGPQECAVEYP